MGAKLVLSLPLILFTTTSGPSVLDDCQQQEKVAYTTTELRLREGPTTESAVLVTLPRAVRVALGDCNLGWCKADYFRTSDGREFSGYVAQAYVSSTQTDASALQALFQAYVETVNSGDAAGWLTFFTEDAVMMPPNEAHVIGKEAIRAWGQPYFDQFDMKEALRPTEIQVAGDWAFVRLEGTFQATPKGGGEPAEEAIKAIWILERQSDGSWKAARTIWNSEASLQGD